MVSRSRSSVRMRRSKSVARKAATPRKSPVRKATRSKSPARKMRSKSPARKTARLSRRSALKRTTSRRKTAAAKPKTEYQKWKAAHKDEITAKVKAMGHTGKNFVGHFSKVAKQMAKEAGVMMKPKARVGSTVRRQRVSAFRKMKAGGLSQSAEQKLRALFSRSPSRYTLRAGKKGTRVALKRRTTKKQKLTKTGKARKTRQPTARNLWFKQHAAEIKAEVMRRGLAGSGIAAYGKVGSEMYKASM